MHTSFGEDNKMSRQNLLVNHDAGYAVKIILSERKANRIKCSIYSDFLKFCQRQTDSGLFTREKSVDLFFMVPMWENDIEIYLSNCISTNGPLPFFVIHQIYKLK